MIMAIQDAGKAKTRKKKQSMLLPPQVLRLIAKAWKLPLPSKCSAYREQLCQELRDEQQVDIPYYEEYDIALIGAIRRCHDDVALCYSRARIVALLMVRDNMTYEEASEFVAFNIEGVGLGPHTPVLLE